MLKVSGNKKLTDWYNKAPENVRAACYFETWLGARAYTYLMLNVEGGPRTIMRVRNDAVNLFETTPLNTYAVNLRWLGIVKKLDKPKKDPVDTSCPIGHLLK